MGRVRYSEWDGSQDLSELNADELIDELGRKLMSNGDLSQILHRMQQDGIRSQGRWMPSIQDLLQRLRQQRQRQLDKYNLGSVVDELRQKLDNILKTERDGIQKRLQEAEDKAKQSGDKLSPEEQQSLLKTVQDMAKRNLEKLDVLPPDVGGKVQELSKYNFMDDDARNQFQELMDMLKKHAMESYGQQMMQSIKNMDPRAIANMKSMFKALNQMLEQRMRGEEPDFDGFMKQFGDYFGPDKPKNLDELVERLQKQIAQARSLLDSLSPKDREALNDLMQSVLDDESKYEMAKLAANLETLFPSDEMRRQYPFSGEESLSYSEAMKLMETLQKEERLEEQLKDSQYSRSLGEIDEKLLKEVLGEESARDVENLRSITKLLEEGGYIRWKDNQYELTPRGMRKIGQKALQDIFAKLRKDRLGGHRLTQYGLQGEVLEETKAYEFGDDFNIHLQKTVMNAIMREPQTPPLKLKIEDFEILKTETSTRSATVLMLDLSLSMPMRGNFEAAKRVTIALDGLIRSQYPRDSLHIVGFSSYAREMSKEDVFKLNWDEFDPYTNMQDGLRLARRLLSKERCTNKQVIMISDGEPTAHFEGGRIFFQYPPSIQTLRATMAEVRRCTKNGIVINTFMLGSSNYFGDFVSQMARVNKGRVFFTSPDSLGKYVLVDYMNHKRERVQ